MLEPLEWVLQLCLREDMKDAAVEMGLQWKSHGLGKVGVRGEGKEQEKMRHIMMSALK